MTFMFVTFTHLFWPSKASWSSPQDWRLYSYYFHLHYCKVVPWIVNKQDAVHQVESPWNGVSLLEALHVSIQDINPSKFGIYCYYGWCNFNCAHRKELHLKSTFFLSRANSGAKVYLLLVKIFVHTSVNGIWFVVKRIFPIHIYINK